MSGSILRLRLAPNVYVNLKEFINMKPLLTEIEQPSPFFTMMDGYLTSILKRSEMFFSLLRVQKFGNGSMIYHAGENDFLHVPRKAKGILY